MGPPGRTARRQNEGRVHRGKNLMANQRNPRKTRVSVWLLPEERKALAKMAREQGTNMSEVIKTHLAKYKIKYASKK
jgi:hypothetical protein